MNWVVVALVVPSAALLLLRTSEPIGVLIGIPIMALVVGTFLFTALALSREAVYFAGFPIAAYKHLLRKASFVLNAIMLLFGLAGMVACLATQQYGPLLSVLVYVVPPALNLKALRELARFGT